MLRGLGWRPDRRDPRDDTFSLSLALRRRPRAEPLPASVSWQSKFPNGADLNQGPLGSCVAHAFAYACLLQNELKGLTHPRVSRLFVYWHARNQHGETDVDAGTYIRDAIKVTNKLGRPAEDLWPYTVSKFTQKPPPSVLMGAFDHRPATYERITTLGAGRRPEFQHALAQGKPVIFGTDVSQAFVDYAEPNAQIERAFVHNQPTPSEIVGGHAMCAIGYDAESVHVIQSWGKDWGVRGFGRLSWNYIQSYMTQDCWAITL